MKLSRRANHLEQQVKVAVAAIGGEPLAGSGFENETPDPEFSECAPAAPEPHQPLVQ
jgi:hypothetical protein